MRKNIGAVLILVSLVSCDMGEVAMKASKVPSKFISSLNYLEVGEKTIYNSNLLFIRRKTEEIVNCVSSCSHECIAELEETVAPYIIKWSPQVNKFIQIKADEPLISKFVNLYSDYKLLEQCSSDIGFSEEEMLFLNEMFQIWKERMARGSDDK